MFRIWTDKLVRICTGAAILLLLAAEQKVCPWLLVPPKPPKSTEAARNPAELQATDKHPPSPSNPIQKHESSRIPLSLTSILPEAMPVRRPSPLNRASLEETVGYCEGTIAYGPLHTSGLRGNQVDGLAESIPPWRLLGRLLPVADRRPPWNAELQVRDPALTSILLRTGPPAA